MLKPIWNTMPGPIGSIQEGDPFSFMLNFTNPALGPLNVQIVSGELPPGLSLNSAGLISGTAELLEIQKVYEFVIRLTNSNGFSERTFNITVNDILPSWGDPNNLGSFVFGSYYEFQFSIFDPGGSIQCFEKISGEFPPGLFLDQNGHLAGVVQEIQNDTTFVFTIRATLDDTKFEDRTFEIEILTTGNRPPIWFTPRGTIGNINTFTSFEFQLCAGDSDADLLTFSVTGLPPGLSMNSSGFISGTLTDTTPTIYTITATVTDGQTSVNRIFKLNANITEIFPIEWITPEGSLGSICEGEKSLFGVKAESQSRTLRYQIISGSLPPGMSMNVNNGDIWGMAFEQGLETTYTFEVEVSNTTESQIREFSITVENCLNADSQTILYRLTGDLRDQFYDLFTSTELPVESWFRQGDDQYGLVETGEILIVQNLDDADYDDIYNELKELIEKNIVFDKIQVAQAVVDDQVVYEVLYRTVYDHLSGSIEEYGDPSSGLTIKPGSFEHMRNRLISQLGSSGGQDQLPLWMTSEQTIGDSSSVLGWIPALVFAHVQPGTGQSLADILNSTIQDNDRLEKQSINIDRVLVKPSAGTSFEPRFIYFGG